MRVVLIDDEILALNYLERQLEKIPGIELVSKFTNPIKGLDYIKNEKVDIAFLDINMPEINGLMLSKKIRKSKPEVKVIFVTAYDQYAARAFELNVEDYIVKPVRFKRLEEIFHRIRQAHPEGEKDQLFINVSNQLLMGKDREELHPLTWRTSKVQELFLYLLKYENKVVNKSFLANLLWPDLKVDNALSQLYTAVYHIKNSIKKYAEHLEIVNSLEGYILKTENTTVNINEWTRRLENLAGVSSHTIDEYERIMDLNKGPYLDAYDYLWAEPVRHRLEEVWVETALEIACFYYKAGEIQQSIHWYEKIKERSEINEEAFFALMKIYAELKEETKVLQLHQLLKNNLSEKLNIEPSEKINSWVETWIKNR